MRTDSCHGVDTTVSARLTRALGQRCPRFRFPLRESLIGQKQTGPLYTPSLSSVIVWGHSRKTMTAAQKLKLTLNGEGGGAGHGVGG